MLYPVIDIGSNTVKLSVLDPDHIFRQAPVFFKAVPLGIKNKIKDGFLPDGATEELITLLKEYTAISSRLTKVFPIAFATASLRGLKNADKVMESIKSETGIVTDLISGEEEAFFSFLGALESKKDRSGISVDMGGGSTELISFPGTRPKTSTSLPFGCLTLTNAFFTGKTEKEECEKYVTSLLRENAPKNTGNEIFLSGGSAKAVVKYKNFITGKNNLSMTENELSLVYDHFFNGNENERKKIEGILKERFALIPAAVTNFRMICLFYGKTRMTVCKNGVREGYLINYLEKIKK